MGDPVVHFEIGGADGDRLEDFYGRLFGWRCEPVASSGGTYRLVVDTGDGIGGGIVTTHGASYLTFYVRVDELEAAVGRAQELGGTVRKAPREVADGIRTALIEDPDGHMVGLMSMTSA